MQMKKIIKIKIERTVVGEKNEYNRKRIKIHYTFNSNNNRTVPMLILN